MASPRAVVAASALCVLGCATTVGTPLVREAEPDANDKAEALAPFGGVCALEPLEPDGAPFDGAAPSQQLPPSVLLELAILSVPLTARRAELPRALDAWIGDPAVQLLAATHRSVPIGERSRTLVEERTGPLARPAVHELSIEAGGAEGGRIALDLTAVLQLPSPAHDPIERRVSFVTAARERTPAVLSAPLPGTPGRELVVLLIPHVVREERDLRAIFLCKMRSRMRGAGQSRSLGRRAPRGDAVR